MKTSHNSKNKAILSRKGNDKKKVKILESVSNKKSQIVYCLLGLFFGGIGIHNFYIGRWERGLAQLLISLFAALFFPPYSSLHRIIIYVIYIWAVFELFTTHTDSENRELKPSPKAKYICGVIGFLLGVLGLINLI